MEANEFRILENGFGFTIQRLFNDDSLKPEYRNKENMIWINIAKNGFQPLFDSVSIQVPSLPPFNTLKEANDYVLKLCKPEVIHKINNNNI